MARRRGVRRPPVTMRVGEPMWFDRYPDDKPLNRRIVADVTEEIRVRHAALAAEVLT